MANNVVLTSQVFNQMSKNIVAYRGQPVTKMDLYTYLSLKYLLLNSSTRYQPVDSHWLLLAVPPNPCHG